MHPLFSSGLATVDDGWQNKTEQQDRGSLVRKRSFHVVLTALFWLEWFFEITQLSPLVLQRYDNPSQLSLWRNVPARTAHRSKSPLPNSRGANVYKRVANPPLQTPDRHQSIRIKSSAPSLDQDHLSNNFLPPRCLPGRCPGLGFERSRLCHPGARTPTHHHPACPKGLVSPPRPDQHSLSERL